MIRTARLPLILLLLCGFAASVRAEDLAVTDLSNATGLTDAKIQGKAVSPKVDHVNYRHLTPRDTLASGKYFRDTRMLPAVWPTLISTSENEFNLSYLIHLVVQGSEGNYYMEKRVRVVPDRDSVAFYCQPFVNLAANDSGTFLSKRIMPAGGMTYVGGYYAKSLLGPGGRVFRVCQRKGGNEGNLYALDTIDPGGGSPRNFETLLDTPLIGGRTFPDYCLNKTGDTIFTAYTPDGSALCVVPVPVHGRNSITTGRNDTLINTGDLRRDACVARDSATGRFLFACVKNNTDLELTATGGDFSAPVTAVVESGLPLINIQSRNPVIASLGNGVFAVAFWLNANGSGGVHLRLVSIATGISVTDSVILEPPSASVFGLLPSFSTAGGRLSVSWFRDNKPGANTGRLYGRVFNIENGAITDTVFSGPLSADSTLTETTTGSPGNYNTAVAIDTVGNILGSYAKSDNGVYLTVWSPVYYYMDTAYAVIEDSLPTAGWGSLAADSVIYSGFSAQNSGGGSVDLFFRSSASRVFSGGDALVGIDSVKGPLLGPHFQFRLQMVSAANLLTRPVVSAVGLHVNVKPKGARIDSFAVNGAAFRPVLQAGDTITLMPRSDTLKVLCSAMDYDNASSITLLLSGYETASQPMVRDSSRHYSKRSLIVPVDHADTVYALRMSVKDTNNWGSDTFTVYVKLRNALPAITALDTVFLFAAKTGQGPVNNSTVFFMKRQKAVFLARFTDLNDSLRLSSRTYLNGVLRGSFANVQSLTDTLKSGSLPGDTTWYSIAVSDPGTAVDSLSFRVIAYNRPPSDSILWRNYYASHDSAGASETLLHAGDTLFIIDSGYTVIKCFGRDSNEIDLTHYLLYNGVKTDSLAGSLNFQDTLYADSVHGLDTVSLVVADSFVSDTTRFYLRVSHLPRLDSVVYKNSHTVFTASGSLKIKNGVPDTFLVYASDPDVVLDDRLTYRMRLNTGIDTTTTSQALSALLVHHPSRTDSSARFFVSDRTGATESFTVNFLYPSFSFGPGYSADSLYFADSIQVFVSNSPTDSVSVKSRSVKIMNSGTDSLRITFVGRKSGSGGAGWLKAGVTDTLLLPGASAFLLIRDSAAVGFKDSAGLHLSSSSADTVIYDTVLFVTTDTERDSFLIPITIRCSEAPYVINDTLLFLGGVPPLPKTGAAALYTPSHSVYRELAMVFSKPMEHLTAGPATFAVYSRADSLDYAAARPDTVAPFPGVYRWSKGPDSRFDTLFYKPALTTGNYVSRHFNVSAPDGFFISSDPVRIKVSSSIADLAGNRMDLYGDRRPDSLRAFKIFRGSIDSSTLVIAGLSPDSGSEGAPLNPRIRILFSTPLDLLSVDTVSAGNRTVMIRSALNPSSPIPLSGGITLTGDTVMSFMPAAKFYGGDTVTVTLSASLRDIYRNTLDGNRDGRGNFFYKYGNAVYTMADSFMTGSDAAGDNYTFRFTTAREDFYFYPCPFEPGRNPRHSALGGIVFKNLHSLIHGGNSG